MRLFEGARVLHKRASGLTTNARRLDGPADRPAESAMGMAKGALSPAGAARGQFGNAPQERARAGGRVTGARDPRTDVAAPEAADSDLHTPAGGPTASASYVAAL